MSDYLLDTHLLIRCLRGMAEALILVERLADEGELYVSVLSRLEVLARTWPREQEATLELLDPLTALPVTAAIADAAGRLIFAQSRQGLALPVPDAIIAATALAHGLTVVSYDLRHLTRIDGLALLPIP